MHQFRVDQSIVDFQRFIESVYSVPDNRIFSLDDLLMNQQRFTMRALKGIRKGDKEKFEYNLLIAFSWLAAVANRLHIDLDEAVWQRFPMVCSYCGQSPCACKTVKPAARVKSKEGSHLRPKTLKQFQEMFAVIYPSRSRTLADAGVHLAEEMGEVSEAVHIFLGEHKDEQFEDIVIEIADYISCIMGAANSAGVDIASGLAKLYTDNCHICHKAPCECKFSYVASFKS